MIPSEFNQDARAARRKLHILHEAKFKVGDRVRMSGQLARDMKREGLSTAGKVTKVNPLGGNVHLKVKWDDGEENGVLGSNVVKEETISEKVDVVAANNKTGEIIVNLVAGEARFDEKSQMPEIDRTISKIQKAIRGRGGTVAIAASKVGKPRSDRRFWSIQLANETRPEKVASWVRKILGESVDLTERDATLEHGLTLSKRGPGSGTWIKVERISGKTYGVFRSFKKMKKIGKRPSTALTVPDEDAFAGPGSDPWGYHKDRESALKLAREIAEKTGERVMIEDHKGKNVKFKLAFASQSDAKVFMSKFSFNGLFGGGSLGKDLAPAGRAFTRIDLGKKSPFFGSEAYEENVEVFPERMKAFLWQLGEAGGAIIGTKQ